MCSDCLRFYKLECIPTYEFEEDVSESSDISKFPIAPCLICRVAADNHGCKKGMISGFNHGILRKFV